MKRLMIPVAFLCLCGGCDKVEKVVESPQVQKDSQNLMETLIQEGEDIIEAETGVKVDVQLPKQPPK